MRVHWLSGQEQSAVSFPQWAERLEQLSDQRRRESWKIVIRWFLGWCKREKRRATQAGAISFLEEKAREKGSLNTVVRKGEFMRRNRW
jgi:hypothetical protein